MARVKIKAQNSNDPRRKRKLLEILSQNVIYVTRIISISDGYIILTESDQELDKVFNNKTDTKLEENELAHIPLF